MHLTLNFLVGFLSRLSLLIFLFSTDSYSQDRPNIPAKNTDILYSQPNQGQVLFAKSQSSEAGLKFCREELKLSQADCAQWQKTVLPAKLPDSRGNKFADRGDAAYMGFHIFFDARLSQKNAFVDCAMCHDPKYAFTDQKPFSKGIRPISRNAPSLSNSGWLSRHFWDGRADSLWTQPLITMQHPDEMGATPLSVAHFVYDYYREPYEKIFGSLPDLKDRKRFPEDGGPGTVVFDKMRSGDRKAILEIFVNIGKSLEATVRKMASGRSWVDLYLLGNQGVIQPEVKEGMKVFTKAGCFSCHAGPMFTDEKPHNLGVPAWPGTAPDEGRAKGRMEQIQNPYNAKSSFYDLTAHKPDYSVEPDSPALRGAFLTPSLRNVAKSAPYGHNGRFGTLEEVINFHLQGGGSASNATEYVGSIDPLLKKQTLSAEELANLIQFLRALNGAPPGLPFAAWIDHG